MEIRYEGDERLLGGDTEMDRGDSGGGEEEKGEGVGRGGARKGREEETERRSGDKGVDKRQRRKKGREDGGKGRCRREVVRLEVEEEERRKKRCRNGIWRGVEGEDREERRLYVESVMERVMGRRMNGGGVEERRRRVVMNCKRERE